MYWIAYSDVIVDMLHLQNINLFNERLRCDRDDVTPRLFIIFATFGDVPCDHSIDDLSWTPTFGDLKFQIDGLMLGS